MLNRFTAPSMSLLLALSAVSLLNVGCTDKKNASTSTFKAALEEHFETQPVCLTLGVTLPNSVQYDAKGNAVGLNGSLESALVGAKVMASKEEMKAIPNAWTGQTTNMRVVTYSAVDPSQWRARGMDPRAMSPCYAKVDVKSVDNFTEPGELLGQRVSRVSFTYTLKDVQPWAHDAGVEQAAPAIKQLASSEERKGLAAIVLTNNGWQVDPNYHL